MLRQEKISHIKLAEIFEAKFLELPRNGNLRKFYLRSFKKAKHSEALLETESWRPCY